METPLRGGRQATEKSGKVFHIEVHNRNCYTIQRRRKENDMHKYNPEIESFENWIMDDNAVMLYDEGEYYCDDNAKEEYCEALQSIICLMVLGKCIVTADHPDKPYQYHTINVQWLFGEDYIIDPDPRLIIKGLTEMDLIISEDGKWQIGKEIYHSL